MISTAIVTSLVGAAVKALAKNFFPSAIKIIDDLAEGKISPNDAKARMTEAQEAAKADIADSLSGAAASMFESGQKTIRDSFLSEDPMVRRAWAFVVWSQTIVLLWYQIGIPVYVKLFGGSFPRTGDELLSWAYALVGAALGAPYLKAGMSAMIGGRR